MFILCWIYLNIQGTGPFFIFAVQYISISLHIFTRYIYISVASRPELRILKLRLNILCALRIYLNTVIFKFYIIHACIRILCYIHLPAWSASRCHKYFLICCTFFMPFYKYSNTFDSTLFYICILTIYIRRRYASRFALLLTYLLYSLYAFL